jgi:hypothetical protein
MTGIEEEAVCFRMNVLNDLMMVSVCRFIFCPMNVGLIDSPG